MDNNNDILIKTLRELQLEKLLIIFKELRHIYSILNFYYDENNNTRIDRTFGHLKKSTTGKLYEVRELLKELKREKESAQENKFKNMEQGYIIFIIKYNQYNLIIKEALFFMEMVTKKIRNVFNEGINQYLPRPILGRRYSSFNMLLFFEEYYNNIYEYILDKNNKNQSENKKILLNWDYIDSYTALSDFLKKDHHYINMAYWYYEIPYLTPAFTHELSHIVLDKIDINIDSAKNENLKIIYEKLKEHFNDFYSNNLELKKVFLNFDNKYTVGMAKEILSDIVAFFIHGDSYLFTFIHSAVINDIDNLFFSDKNDKYILNRMEFSFKRDFSIIRAYILLIVREVLMHYRPNYVKFLNDSESKLFLNNIYSLLYVFYPLNRDIVGKKYGEAMYSYSLKDIYNNYPNIKENYEKIFDFIEYFLMDIKKFILLNEKELINLFDDLKDFKYHLNLYKYWDNRISYFYDNYFVKLKKFKYFMNKKQLTLMDYQYYFNEFCDKSNDSLKDKYYIRELVLTTLKESNKNEYNDNPLLFKDLENYEIVYIKTKYNQAKNYQELKASIKSFLDKTYNTEGLVLHDVLGIYDFLYFRQINKKNKIHHQINSNEYLNINKDVKFYENRYSLLKISKDIFFDNSKNINNKNTFLNAIIHIEIEAKEKTNELLNKLYTFFYEFIKNVQIYMKEKVKNEENFLFKKASFFKSLGPKDFIIIIEESNANTIFELKEYFSNKFKNDKVSIKRTFTNIFLDENDKKLQNRSFPIDNYCFCTTFRFSNIDYQEIQDKLKNEECINRVLVTPGIFDFEIEWNEKVKAKNILKVYNMFMANGATDIVSNIHKVLK